MSIIDLANEHQNNHITTYDLNQKFHSFKMGWIARDHEIEKLKKEIESASAVLCNIGMYGEGSMSGVVNFEGAFSDVTKAAYKKHLELSEFIKNYPE